MDLVKLAQASNSTAATPPRVNLVDLEIESAKIQSIIEEKLEPIADPGFRDAFPDTVYQ